MRKARKKDEKFCSRLYSKDFEIFKSNVQHKLRSMGDFEFMLQLVEEDAVNEYLSEGHEKEAMYLLSAIDYLSRVNELPLIEEYEPMRSWRMENPVWPRDVILLSIINENDDAKKQAVEHSIPEFLAHNIIEGNLRDVW